MKPTDERWALGARGAVGLLLLASWATPAATQTAVIYACYVPVTGVFYRIKETGLRSACLTGHTEFNWTLSNTPVDHGTLTGLLDDDHPQYLLTNGARTLTGNQDAGGNKITNLAAATGPGDALRYEQAVKPGDAAGGDLLGAFPNPTVARLQGTGVAATAPAAGNVLTFNGTAWAPAAPTGGGGVTDHGALTGLLDDDHPQYLLTNGARTLTGNQDAGGNRITNLAAATAPGDALRFDQAVKPGDGAGGDLTGSFPNPSVTKLRGTGVAATTPVTGNVLTFNGTAWAPAVPTTGVTNHGALTGLLNDDHPQYLLTNGARTLTGNQSAGGNKITNLAAASVPGDAVRFEQAVKPGDAAGGDLSGAFPNPSVAGLRGKPVASAAPATGNVLTFNGSAWAPAVPTTGVTDHGALTGLLDDDHPQYLLANGSRALSGNLNVTGTATIGGNTSLAGHFNAGTDGSVLATGQTGVGTIPAVGPGVRMMWYPKKVAFRAGGVNGSEWDDAIIGEGSVAMGEFVIAAGKFSVALGTSTVANGVAATALGSSTTANGNYSTALGTQTKASGTTSTAMGVLTVASGSSATALGSSTTAGGASATALGNSTSASGDYSTTMGTQTTASGIASTALGSSTTASGNYSTALGTQTTASGAASTAMGVLASTGGHQGAFVYGDNSTSSTLQAGADNEFAVRAAGGFRFRTASDLSTGCNLPAGSGSWSCTSSRTAKHDFLSLDAESVLGKVAGLSVQSWSYRGEAGGVRHVGPVAEDFHDAFGLGPDSASIGSIDEAGITLVAVQALVARTAQLRHENESLRATVADLEARLDRLAARLSQLAGSQ